MEDKVIKLALRIIAVTVIVNVGIFVAANVIVGTAKAAGMLSRKIEVIKWKKGLMKTLEEGGMGVLQDQDGNVIMVVVKQNGKLIDSKE